MEGGEGSGWCILPVLRKVGARLLIGVVAQLVERLICIQEAWGSTPHNSIFFILSHHDIRKQVVVV